MKIKLAVKTDYIDGTLLDKLTIELSNWLTNWGDSNNITVKLDEIKNKSKSADKNTQSILEKQLVDALKSGSISIEYITRVISNNINSRIFVEDDLVSLTKNKEYSQAGKILGKLMSNSIRGVDVDADGLKEELETVVRTSKKIDTMRLDRNAVNIGKAVTDMMKNGRAEVTDLVNLMYSCGEHHTYAFFQHLYQTVVNLVENGEFKRLGKKIAAQIRTGQLNADKFSEQLPHILLN